MGGAGCQRIEEAKNPSPTHFDHFQNAGPTESLHHLRRVVLVAALREVKGVTEEFPHIGQHVVRTGAVGHDHLEVHGVGVGGVPDLCGQHSVDDDARGGFILVHVPANWIFPDGGAFFPRL